MTDIHYLGEYPTLSVVWKKFLFKHWRTGIGLVGYKAQILDTEGDVFIARKGCRVNNLIGYIPLILPNKVTIFASGDSGLSWHSLVAFKNSLMPFEKGFAGADSQGYVYGVVANMKVTKWKEVTKWVKNRYVDLDTANMNMHRKL